MRKVVVALITFVGGAYFLFEFMLPARAPDWLGGWGNPLTPYRQFATDLTIILGAMAFLLGPLNLVRSSFASIARQAKGWNYSIVFLVFLVIGGGAQIARDRSEAARHLAVRTERATLNVSTAPAGNVADTPLDTTEDVTAAVAADPVIPVVVVAAPAEERTFALRFFDLMFRGVVQSFGLASMALLALYLVSAAFRSFRFQNIDSAVMMVTALIVMVGLAPLTDLLTSGFHSAFQPNSWARWILDVPNTAVQRAVAIGVCAGAFAVGVRHWLSLGRRTE